jgi:hypothetical protein
MSGKLNLLAPPCGGETACAARLCVKRAERGLSFRKIHAQSNRNDGNLPCRADVPAPNMTYDRWFLRSPPQDRDATLRRPSPPSPACGGGWGGGRHPIQRQRGVQCVALRRRLHFDAGRADLGRDTHPASIAIEPICRPLRRGRKVEFVVRGAASTDECLEAGVPPKLIGTRSRYSGRHAQIADPAGDEIRQRQASGAWARDVHFDACRCRAKRVRMKFQRQPHLGIVARQQAARIERSNMRDGAANRRRGSGSRPRPGRRHWRRAPHLGGALTGRGLVRGSL